MIVDFYHFTSSINGMLRERLSLSPLKARYESDKALHLTIEIPEETKIYKNNIVLGEEIFGEAKLLQTILENDSRFKVRKSTPFHPNSYRTKDF